jgi:hypothetical protein
MIDPHAEIEAAIAEATKARQRTSRKKTAQLAAEDEREVLKATALAWLRSHRLAIGQCVSPSDLKPIDDIYSSILAATEMRALRSRYLNDLRDVKNLLVALRSRIVVAASSTGNAFGDSPPGFAALAPDPKMQAILVRRWQETIRCIGADANLAATVMMGGLLEALFLARVNQLADKKAVFTAKFAPRDRQGRTLPLDGWTLRNYVDVAHELGWITLPAKSISEVLRDYRNYIHPQKELSHGVQISQNDACMFWSVFKSLTSQILESIGR